MERAGSAAQASKGTAKLAASDLLTDDQNRAAQSVSFGEAKWMVRLELPYLDNGIRLPGRPERFAVANGFIHTPFQDRILNRHLDDGTYGPTAPRLGGIIDQVACSQAGIAVTFRPPTVAQSLDAGRFIAMKTWTGDGIRELNGHACMPWRVCVSPDGTRVASCADDKTMRLWDADSGQELATFPGYGYGGNLSTRRGEFVSFSPDGKWLATAFEHRISLRRPSDGKEVAVWNLDQHLEVFEILQGIRFSADSQSLLAFRPMTFQPHDRQKFFLWSIRSAKQTIFIGDHDAIDGRLSEDGENVFTWNTSPALALWDVRSKNVVRTVNVAPKHLWAIAFSKTANMIAAAGDDGEVRFWNFTTFEKCNPERRYKHKGIQTVQFSDDGTYLVTSAADGSLAVWDTPSHE